MLALAWAVAWRELVLWEECMRALELVSPGAQPVLAAAPVGLEEPLPAEEALRSARRNLRFGCLGLPWLWAVNVWLYWPVLTKAGARAAAAAGGDLLQFRQCVVRSALGAGAAAATLLAWVLAYQLGGPGLLGERAYQKLDVVGAFY